MTFPPIEYVEWIEGQPERATHDLATSDLHGRHEEPLPAEEDPSGDAATLRRELASLYGLSPDRLLVTAGATAATFLAMATVFETSDVLLVERPGYEAHEATPRGLGATVERFERRPSASYDLDLDRLAEHCSTDTGAIVLTNRHNPSGRLLDRDTLADAAAIARDHDARLLVDEVYAPYGTTGDGSGPFGGVTAAGIDGTIVTSSLTKFHGYGGLRIGWLVADESFVDRARSVAVHLPTVAEPSCRLATPVISSADRSTADVRRLHDRNAELLASFVDRRQNLSGVADCSYGFLTHEEYTGTELAEAAAAADVLVVPGRFFGDEDRVRVSLGGSPDEMAAALEAFGMVLDEL
jgi:aspartate/methionine/tyrosine aminotransferase